MCHYVTNRCEICHIIFSSSPINCGKGLTVLGPDGLTVECEVESREVVEETEAFWKCVDERKESSDNQRARGRVMWWLR
jgi:hypothetical protein